MLGKIKVYKEEKGYGWIKIDGLLAVQFFHCTQWRHPEVPVAGQLVQFELGPDHKGRTEAKNITRVSGNAAVSGVRQ
jgi:cold shock CspA family protein